MDHQNVQTLNIPSRLRTFHPIFEHSIQTLNVSLPFGHFQLFVLIHAFTYKLHSNFKQVSTLYFIVIVQRFHTFFSVSVITVEVSCSLQTCICTECSVLEWVTSSHRFQRFSCLINFKWHFNCFHHSHNNWHFHCNWYFIRFLYLYSSCHFNYNLKHLRVSTVFNIFSMQIYLLPFPVLFPNAFWKQQHAP